MVTVFTLLALLVVSGFLFPWVEERTGDRRIKLLADAEEGWMDYSQFVDEAEDVVFFTDSKWRHVNGTLTASTFNGESVPAAVVPNEAAMNFLWEVPGFSKTVMRLDLSSFSQNKTVNIDRELAIQYHKKLKNQFLSSSEPVKREIEPCFERAGELLERENFQGSLNESMWCLEKLTIRRAEERIGDRRKKRYEVKLTKEDGSPLENATVSYRLTEHSFDFGFFESPLNEKMAGKIEDLGFNTYNQFAFWHETEPKDNRWNFTSVKKNFRRDDNFRAGISGLVGDTPSYASQISGDALRREIIEHVNKTVEEVESIRDVEIWECYGLGMRYMADQTLQMTVNRSKEDNLRSTKTCIRTVKRQTNDTVVVTGWNIDGSEIRNRTYDDVPYTYYEKLRNKNINFSIGFDFMYFGGAHEIYSELVKAGIYRKEAIGDTEKNWIPMHNLYTLSKMLEWYSTLDRKIYIQYFQAPSNQLEGQQGYWHGPWDEKTQADWIRKYYKVVYSKPEVGGINYLEVKDSEWKDFKTGILYRNGTSKKSYYALKELLDGWKTYGKTKTDSSGKITFEGFEGRYSLNISKEGYEEKEVVLDKKRKIFILEKEI